MSMARTPPRRPPRPQQTGSDSESQLRIDTDPQSSEEEDSHTSATQQQPKQPSYLKGFNDFQIIGDGKKKRKRKRKSDGRTTTTTELQPIPTSNRFHSLSENDEGMNPDVQQPQDEVKKQPKPPPIIIRNINDFRLLAKTIDKACKDNPIFQTKGETTRLTTITSNDFRAAVKALKELNIEYHTFTPLGERASKVVIKGLDKSTEIDWIKEELISQDIHAEEILQLKSQRGEKALLPLFLVKVDPTELKKMYEITKLCMSRVTVDKYIAPGGPPQCYRCQKYGHVAKYCMNKHKCLKCAKNHSTHECDKQRDTQATCANCGGTHTANWKGCPAYQSLRSRLEATKPRAAEHQNKPKQRQLLKAAPIPTTNPWSKHPNHLATLSLKHYPALPLKEQRALPAAQPPPATIPPQTTGQGVAGFNNQPTPGITDIHMQQDNPTEAIPTTTSTAPPALFDMNNVMDWANKLLQALNAATSSKDRMDIIVSMAMPIFLIQSVTSQHGK
jgi:Associated with zinc fingers